MKPRFEKVDDNTIKIIVEHVDNAPLYAIVESKKRLETQKAGIEKTLKNINEILENAKRLGIIAKYPEKPINRLPKK